MSKSATSPWFLAFVVPYNGMRMPKSYRRALCWLRRDLRLSDHAALALATREANEVAVCFVFDRNILDPLERPDARVSFIERSLRELDAKLQAHGSALIVRHGDPVIAIPRLARELGVDAVYAAEDYEPYARRRDDAVGRNVSLKLVKDVVIFSTDEIRTRIGGPFSVYTPYSRAWREKFVPEVDARLYKPDLGVLMKRSAEDWSSGFPNCDPWVAAGEDAARQSLREFRLKAFDYAEHRDFPAENATSVLSPHLRFGTISIRELVRTALEAGADKWLAELIWREFYQHILWHWPEVETTTFLPQYRSLEWPGSQNRFEAWCRGETGYPIVDAAMRCLNETGWMHNRLRMVVASFLSKDLLVDYREGERYFARKLLDYDLASNNGGWQWSASVGCDAQPYFRIFNPVLQSKKFDPNGVFLRRWIPEIASLDDRLIHAPGVLYIPPIVDHAVQRDAAIRLFKRSMPT